MVGLASGQVQDRRRYPNGTNFVPRAMIYRRQIRLVIVHGAEIMTRARSAELRAER
jgi:hypothetical protein